MKKSKLFQAKNNYAELSALIPEDASNIRSNHGPVLAAIKAFQNHPALLILNKENLTRPLVFKTQMQMKSTKLIKT